MPVNDISLAGGMRQNLAQLQLVAALQARTTSRLATGNRVNSAIDDPAAYFAAANARSRASDLSARKDAAGEALQTVQAATQGIDAITSLIQQAKGLAAAARGATTSERASLATQYGNLRTQIDQLAGDASYKGINFLSAGSSLKVDFNESGTSNLTVTGFDATSTGIGVNAAVGSWATDGNIDTATGELDTALSTLRSGAKGLSSNSSVITTRQDFTANLINTLTTGADRLTAADTNEEGANMLALQTRQQLGVVALSLTNQAQQSILRLF